MSRNSLSPARPYSRILCCLHCRCNIFSFSFEEHLQHVERVLSRLIKTKMKVNPNNCFLFQDRIEFWGIEISADVIAPLETKVEAIMEIPEPRKQTEIREFINTVKSYRR